MDEGESVSGKPVSVPQVTSGARGLAVVLGAGALLGFIVLGDRTIAGLALALVASMAAGTIAMLVVQRPAAAFAVILLLASLSRVVIDLPVGRVRLEQPAIIAAFITLTVTHGWPRRALIRPLLPLIGAFAVYLVVLTLASIVNAPAPMVSARMIIWTLLSMAGGAVTFALLVRRGEAGSDTWFTVTGVAHALIGLAAAAAFLAMGPNGIPGIQLSPGEPPKVAGFAFEANLYASMLAGLAPFAIERFRTRPRPATAVPVILILAAVGLGVTRGAYLGLAAGLLVYLAVVALRVRRHAELGAVIPVLIVGVLLAPSLASVTLPVDRPAVAHPSQTPGASGGGGAVASPSTGPSIPTPAPSPTPVANTLVFRLDRIPAAIADLKSSPLIGLGAASYGQRHALPYTQGAPDYIGILALVALYESGVVGAAALGLGFLLALFLLLRASAVHPGPAAAYVASLIVLLVAYQATNALFFSINWIILGAGLAMVARTGAREPN